MTLLSIFLFTCSSNIEYKTQALPSGKEIKILSIGQMYFTNDDPALMLKYQTDIDIDSINLLRKEIEEIWPVFRINVDNAGLSKAIINASQVPKMKMFFYTNKSQNFLFTRKQNGTWEFPDSWDRDYNAETELISEKYLNFIMQNKFIEAASILNYPDYFTAEELKSDISSISKSLQIASDELGAVISYKKNEYPFKIYKVGFYGGSSEFWDKYPVFMKQIYDVEFSKNTNGYLILNFSIIKDKLVLSSLEYGLAMDTPNNKETIERIYFRYKNELEKSTLTHNKIKY